MTDTDKIKPPSLPAEELSALVRAIARGQVVTAHSIPEETVPMVFPGVRTLWKSGLDWDSVGTLWANWADSKAPEGEGLPLFASFHIVDKADWARVLEAANALTDRIEALIDDDFTV